MGHVGECLPEVRWWQAGPGERDDDRKSEENNRYEEKITYIHPDLEDILKPTYGIIIYQEQIMRIVRKMASYSYGEADILRRAM